MTVNIPELAPHEGSWTVVCKTSGRAVTEIFRSESDHLHNIDSDRFYIETIGAYLARVNSEVEKCKE